MLIRKQLISPYLIHKSLNIVIKNYLKPVINTEIYGVVIPGCNSPLISAYDTNKCVIFNNKKSLVLTSYKFSKIGILMDILMGFIVY